MGYESSHIARRRLASVAMSNRRVQDALLAMAPAAEAPADQAADGASAPSAPSSSGGHALALELEALAHDIVATPGAGGALIATFAEQARVLQLVALAAERAPHAPLPADVRLAVAAAVQAGRQSAAGSAPFSAAPSGRP